MTHIHKCHFWLSASFSAGFDFLFLKVTPSHALGVFHNFLFPIIISCLWVILFSASLFNGYPFFQCSCLNSHHFLLCLNELTYFHSLNNVITLCLYFLQNSYKDASNVAVNNLSTVGIGLRVLSFREWGSESSIFNNIFWCFYVHYGIEPLIYVFVSDLFSELQTQITNCLFTFLLGCP